jgi:hypothetical protein
MTEPDTAALDRFIAADRAATAARVRHIEALMGQINDLFASASYKFQLIVNPQSFEQLQGLYVNAHGQRAKTIETLVQWFGALTLDAKIAALDRKPAEGDDGA